MICFGLATLFLLSLLTYDAGDLARNQMPPNSPPRNLIGALGAWLGYLSFLSVGLAAFLLPIALALLGVAIARREREPSLRRLMLFGLSLVACSALLMQLLFGAPRTQYAPVGAGGWLGALAADGVLRQFLSRPGAVLVIGTAWLVSLVFLTNFRPSIHVPMLGNFLRNHLAAWLGRRPGGRSHSPELEVRDYLLDRGGKVTSPTVTDPAAAPPPSEGEPTSSVTISESRTEAATVSPMVELPRPASKPARKKRALAAPPPAAGDYVYPTAELLNPPPPIEQREIKDDLKHNAEVLAATLADFNIEVRVGEVQRGPVITRYEVYPAPGVRVERIAGLSNNIALAMKATHVRIQTPVPGKGCVGIEVPNTTTAVVYLREIIESDEWRSRRCKVPIALGKDISGVPLIADLAEMPHLLIAGATGSGKTVCVNSLITSLLFYSSPKDLRLVMIDPKIVEMQNYKRLPHLWMPIVTETKKVPLALRKLIDEMESRYRLFAKVGVRNIAAFNSRPVEPKGNEDGEVVAALFDQEEIQGATEAPIPDRLPYIVVFVDELADVMLVAGKDVEMSIARLAQLARAVGIHMVLSTQRPSVDVITGVIKANFPARVAFQVASKQDSRVILDANGADKLIGRGDMLYLPPGSSKLIRAQGTYVQDDEIHRVVRFLEKHCPPAFTEEQVGAANGDLPPLEEEEDEELLEQCIEVIRQTRRASVSILQRRLRIGYTRAARIMDLLEQRGIVGPSKGAEPREILVDLDAEVGETR